MRNLLVSLIVLLGIVGWAFADRVPRTPTFMINQKVSWVEVGEKGRVYVDYNVLPVGAQGFKLHLFHYQETPKRNSSTELAL